MDPWREFGATVAVSFGDIGPLILSSKSSASAYTYARTLSQANVVTGLK
jgi:hypothetical protein